ANLVALNDRAGDRTHEDAVEAVPGDQVALSWHGTANLVAWTVVGNDDSMTTGLEACRTRRIRADQIALDDVAGRSCSDPDAGSVAGAYDISGSRRASADLVVVAALVDGDSRTGYRQRGRTGSVDSDIVALHHTRAASVQENRIARDDDIAVARIGAAND